MKQKRCDNCKHCSGVAEATWAWQTPLAYFCKLYHFEYEVCDVGMVSPNYVCDDYEPQSS